jgi:phosphoglycolate phosphatase
MRYNKSASYYTACFVASQHHPKNVGIYSTLHFGQHSLNHLERIHLFMSTYQTLFFDLDGTLTDSKPGITKSVQYALKHFDIVVDDLDTLTPFVGPPLSESFRNVYHFDDEQIKKAIYYYRERYLSIGMFENSIYPGIPELLQTLKARGTHLYVATAKPTVQAKPILAHFQLDQYFEYVSGTSLTGSPSTKSEVIAHIFETFPDINKATTAMIGDREHDIHGAHNNEIASIAVRYGYGTQEEIAAVAPTHTVHTVQALADLLHISQ